MLLGQQVLELLVLLEQPVLELLEQPVLLELLEQPVQLAS